MVRIPKRFKRLLPDPLMGRGVHQHHAKEHDMSCNPTSFCVVNLNCFDGADMIFFDIVKAASVRTMTSWSEYFGLLHIMSRCMDYGEKQKGIGDLTMKPYRFI